jgi:DNA-binding MarR family transcriptional regulator
MMRRTSTPSATITSATTSPARTSEAELASRLRLVVARLARRLRRETEGDVSPSQISALSSIARLGPLTLGELSAAEGVRPPTMTRVVACLEEAGLVSRTIDPADRRVAHVAVTSEGHRWLDRNRRRKDAFLASRLGALDSDETATLARAVELLERLAETE